MNANHRFGRLTTVEYVGMCKQGQLWLCLCDCGKNKVVKLSHLINGNTKSCGCLHREKLVARNYKHGRNGSKLHKIWQWMRARCRRINSPGTSEYYHDRGITVCLEWDDFCIFLRDMGSTYSIGMTIERKDNDKGYSKENCTWVPMGQQSLNRTYRKASYPKMGNRTGRHNRNSLSQFQSTCV